MNVVNSPLTFIWAGDFNISASAAGTFVVELQVDGVTIKTYSFNAPVSGPFTFFWDIFLTPGNRVISLKSSVTGGGGYGGAVAGVMKLIDLRR